MNVRRRVKNTEGNSGEQHATMAAGNSRELCSICQERYYANVREPVAILCGHSFCRPCIVNLQQVHASVRCPTCSRVHNGLRPEDLPTNYLLLGVIENISAQREEPKTCEEESRIESEADNLKEKCCKDSDSSSDSDSDGEDIKKEKNKGEEKQDLLEPKNDPENDRTKLCIETISRVQEPKKGKKFPDNINKVLIWALIVLIAFIGGLLSCYVIAPAILKNWGFGEKGPIKHTYATKLMSETSKAYNNTIPKDSWASWYQAAGQKGFNDVTMMLLFFSGFFIFFMIEVVFVCVWYSYKRCKNECEKGKSLLSPEVPLTQGMNSPT